MIADDSRQPWVAAIDAARGGEQLLRTDGMRADRLVRGDAADDGRVYYAGLLLYQRIAEVGALDVADAAERRRATPAVGWEHACAAGCRRPALRDDSGARAGYARIGRYAPTFQNA